ncbi:hypothetical protein ACLI4Z_15795 [Natrialbaceae archaeon A-arb3/5]
MRFKPVPEPPTDLETVADIQAAVPSTAGPVDEARSEEGVDCCARVIRETSVGNRNDAGTWLTFLRALELVRVVDGEYGRTERPVDPAVLRPAFRERVHGVDRVLDVLEESEVPLGTAAVVDRVGSNDGDGRRRPSAGVDPEERIERVLEWAVLFGIAERTRVDDELRWTASDE